MSLSLSVQAEEGKQGLLKGTQGHTDGRQSLESHSRSHLNPGLFPRHPEAQ